MRLQQMVAPALLSASSVLSQGSRGARNPLCPLRAFRSADEAVSEINTARCEPRTTSVAVQPTVHH